MEQAVSLKQVQSLLRSAAQQLHDVFHSALQLWLHIQEAPQQQKQSLQAEAAVQAVQAALHAASMCATDDLKLSWMKLHVPSVSMAVKAYVVTQYDIRLKRMSILQQLMAGQGGAPSEHLSASLEAETELHWQLFAASKISTFLLPLSTVMKALSGGWNVASGSSPTKQQQEQCKCSYRQRDQLLAGMASELESEHACIVKPLERLGQLLADAMAIELPLPLPNQGYSHDALILELRASMVWLRVALSLPPTDRHKAPQAFFGLVDWEAHMYSIIQHLPLDVPHGDWGAVMCSVLARPDLYKCLGIALLYIPNLLWHYGVGPQQMREAGVIEKALQLILPIVQMTQDDEDAWRHSVRERMKRMGGQGETHAAEDSSSCADSSLDEMQALVKLMYGKLDSK